MWANTVSPKRLCATNSVTIAVDDSVAAADKNTLSTWTAFSGTGIDRDDRMHKNKRAGEEETPGEVGEVRETLPSSVRNTLSHSSRERVNSKERGNTYLSSGIEHPLYRGCFCRWWKKTTLTIWYLSQEASTIFEKGGGKGGE